MSGYFISSSCLFQFLIRLQDKFAGNIKNPASLYILQGLLAISTGSVMSSAWLMAAGLIGI